MNLNSVHAQVRLYIPEAGIAEMNKYLGSAMDEINSRGLERIVPITVTSPAGDYNADPLMRTDGQAFNYYPLMQCIVLPSTVSNVSKLLLNDVAIQQISLIDCTIGSTLQYYAISDTGEIYFTVPLVDGDVVKITGRASAITAAVLPDRYIPYLTYAILSGLYSDEYKNPDQYAIYSRKAKSAYNSAASVNRGNVQGIKRNGRLY